MDKKIGLFWLRDDFRITKNHGLIEATKNHEQRKVQKYGKGKVM